ncbi:MAG: ornithine carbamoyltransferase [Rhodobacteraceae bacterium]|nr:ornithine carbamoyltransferase [Paracoccaceae bacterium]MCY4196663.1 ornithine carbamoyltransferase [Paracoccaceae bacterium]
MPDFLDICQVDPVDLRAILDQATDMKKRRAGLNRGAIDQDAPLAGMITALIFEKPSTRTRISFDVGVRQLGGQPILLSGGETHLGQTESVSDTARVISRFADLAMIRTFDASSLHEFAVAADIPLINGLTDQSHPCQVLADIMTFEEHRGSIKGKHVTWLGVGSNVCNSFVEAAAQFGFTLTFSGPDDRAPDAAALGFAESHGTKIRHQPDPERAVADADLVVTDVWSSMHDSVADKDALNASLRPFQVNEQLMARTKPETLFMHCLPAHRGEEVTSAVLDGAKSVVFDEAENRLHAQKGILRWCLQV